MASLRACSVPAAFRTTSSRSSARTECSRAMLRRLDAPPQFKQCQRRSRRAGPARRWLTYTSEVARALRLPGAVDARPRARLTDPLPLPPPPSPQLRCGRRHRQACFLSRQVLAANLVVILVVLAILRGGGGGGGGGRRRRRRRRRRWRRRRRGRCSCGRGFNAAALSRRLGRVDNGGRVLGCRLANRCGIATRV